MIVNVCSERREMSLRSILLVVVVCCVYLIERLSFC